MLLLRHYAIYCIKFQHFDIFKEVSDTVLHLHNKDLGVSVAAVTVSDSFYLHYLSCYLTHKSNMRYLAGDKEILSSLVKVLTYTAPDPVPDGTSMKEKLAASKSGWYDRLIQAEIVLGLFNSLSSDLIADDTLRKRIWKKMAPPAITQATVPAGLGEQAGQRMDRWLKLWENWESQIKAKNVENLDREKLKKIKMTLKIKKTPEVKPVKLKLNLGKLNVSSQEKSSAKKRKNVVEEGGSSPTKKVKKSKKKSKA